MTKCNSEHIRTYILVRGGYVNEEQLKKLTTTNTQTTMYRCVMEGSITIIGTASATAIRTLFYNNKKVCAGPPFYFELGGFFTIQSKC